MTYITYIHHQSTIRNKSALKIKKENGANDTRMLKWLPMAHCIQELK